MKINGQTPNLNAIKTGFKEYLENLEEQNNADYKSDEYSSSSIFLYSKEFKDYLVKEIGLDKSILSQNISEIMKAISLDEKEEEMPSEVEETEEPETDEAEENGDDNFMAQILNEALAQDEVIDVLDLDKSGDLSEDEISEFINNINGQEDDDNPNELSFDELAQGIRSILDGTYLEEEGEVVEDKVEEEDETLSKEVEEVKNNTPSTSSTGGGARVGGGGGGSVARANSSNTQNQQEQPKILTDEDKSIDELKNTVRPQNEKALETAKTTLDEVTNDEGEIAPFKKDLDEAYDSYLASVEEVNKDLAQALNAKKEEISKQEELITKKEADIINQDAKISALQTNLDNLNSTKNQLVLNKNQLEALLNNPEIDSEKQAGIKSDIQALAAKISAIEEKITKAETDLSEAKTSMEEMKTDLTTQKETLSTLKTEDGDLESQLNSLMTTNPEIKEFYDNYNDKKALYDSKKQELMIAAGRAIQEAQAALNKVDSIISKKETAEITTQFSPDKYTKPKLFDENLELGIEKYGDGAMPYIVLGPKNPDPNKEYPVLFYLHGAGQVGTSLNNIENSNVNPIKLMQEWDLDNFNGYVICPLLRSGSWSNQTAANNIRGIYDSFSQTHNINKDKVALTGASLGGMGTLYVANACSDIFCRAAALSPYNTQGISNGLNIPTKAFVGSNDDPNSYRFTMNTLSKLIGQDNITVMQGSSHSSLPKDLLNTDNDGNGCSDVLEWLFSD